MLFLILILLGVFTGALAGLFGIGGGLFFTPILFFVFQSSGFQDPVTWTIGTSLFCTFTAALSSSLQQYNEKNSFLRQGITIGVIGAVGVYFGKLIVTSGYYNERVFVTVFAVVLMLVAGLFYLRGRSSNIQQPANGDKIGWFPLSFAGGGGGFIASLAGVGGGVVIVPTLNLWFRQPILKAVSISSLAVLIISLSGWIQFALLPGAAEESSAVFAFGFVDFGSALPLIIGAFLGGFIGVRTGTLLSQKHLQIGFSILAIVVATMMIRSVF